MSELEKERRVRVVQEENQLVFTQRKPGLSCAVLSTVEKRQRQKKKKPPHKNGKCGRTCMGWFVVREIFRGFSTQSVSILKYISTLLADARRKHFFVRSCGIFMAHIPATREPHTLPTGIAESAVSKTRMRFYYKHSVYIYICMAW